VRLDLRSNQLRVLVAGFSEQRSSSFERDNTVAAHTASGRLACN